MEIESILVTEPATILPPLNLWNELFFKPFEKTDKTLLFVF